MNVKYTYPAICRVWLLVATRAGAEMLAVAEYGMSRQLGSVKQACIQYIGVKVPD
jgi:hypothetical protein